MKHDNYFPKTIIRFFSLFTVLTIVVACNNVNENKKSRSNKNNLTEANENVESKNQKDDADEFKRDDKIIDKVFTLPEVKERAEYIKNETDGKRNLKIWIAARPDETDGYFWVKVGEDNGMSLVTHFDFYVYPETMEIFFYDVLTDSQMSLTEWRKSVE